MKCKTLTSVVATLSPWANKKYCEFNILTPNLNLKCQQYNANK